MFATYASSTQWVRWHPQVKLSQVCTTSLQAHLGAYLQLPLPQLSTRRRCWTIWDTLANSPWHNWWNARLCLDISKTRRSHFTRHLARTQSHVRITASRFCGFLNFHLLQHSEPYSSIRWLQLNQTLQCVAYTLSLDEVLGREPSVYLDN